MSFNKATYATLITLVLLAVFYFMYANSLSTQQSTGTIGASYFPKLLSTALIILCIISFFQTLKKEDTKISLPNLGITLTVIAITVLYLISWNFLGFFYINTFLYLLILFILLKRSKKHIWLFLITALVMNLFIYFLFERLLYIKF